MLVFDGEASSVPPPTSAKVARPATFSSCPPCRTGDDRKLVCSRAPTTPDNFPELVAFASRRLKQHNPSPRGRFGDVSGTAAAISECAARSASGACSTQARGRRFDGCRDETYWMCSSLHIPRLGFPAKQCRPIQHVGFQFGWPRCSTSRCNRAFHLASHQDESGLAIPARRRG